MTEAKDVLIVSASTEIEKAIWRIEDSRTRTLERIKDMPEDALDWHVEGYPNSISTLLYHIVAIEADWLFSEVIGEGFELVDSLFPYDVRDTTGRLTVIEGISLKEHLERLSVVRQHLLNTFKVMSKADYRRKRELSHYFVTPEWVIHHLCQHEAEHRGEVTMILSLYKAHESKGL